MRSLLRGLGLAALAAVAGWTAVHPLDDFSRYGVFPMLRHDGPDERLE